MTSMKERKFAQVSFEACERYQNEAVIALEPRTIAEKFLAFKPRLVERNRVTSNLDQRQYLSSRKLKLCSFFGFNLQLASEDSLPFLHSPSTTFYGLDFSSQRLWRWYFICHSSSSPRVQWETFHFDHQFSAVKLELISQITVPKTTSILNFEIFKRSLVE